MKNRSYTTEFKKQALDLADSLGSTSKAAEKLGICDANIYGWRKKNFADTDNGALTQKELIEELNDLKRENAELKMVNRSGYYTWLTRPQSNRQQHNDMLLSQVKQIYYDSRGTYGLPRIQAVLRNFGQFCGKARISTLMQKASYIPTDEGFLFLATIIDLCTKKVVGFSTAEHMRTELILTALEMALGRQNLSKEKLVSHSDRGSQYASDEYRKKLAQFGITASMSRNGNCWDNAYAESFFATLKKELVYRGRYATRDEAKKSIFEFIEVWQNRGWIHSSSGYQTPI